MERIGGDVPYYRFSGWDGITHAIFTRHGGVSPEEMILPVATMVPRAR